MKQSIFNLGYDFKLDFFKFILYKFESSLFY